MKNLLMTALLMAGVLSGCNSQNASANTADTNPVKVNAEEVTLEDGIYAKLETTNGEILFKFELEKAPMTSANFIALAEGNKEGVSANYASKPYFDGLSFHRVIPGFMIQGGDPAGNGSGGPGYEFPNETDGGLSHNKGVVSMANAGPNTNGSQFFITVAPTKQLDGSYSIFGKVVSGQNVADAISKVDRNPQDKPNTPVVMNKVTIIRIGKDAEKFDANKVFNEGVANFRKAQEEALKESMVKVDEISKGFDVTSTGLRIKIEEPTKGAQPVAGQKVAVHYTGTFVDGKKFDSSLDRGTPIEFVLGQGQVIKGWDEAIGMMHVGEKAMLVIPPDLAYGAQPRGPIPGNSWLVFEVELVEIK